MSTIEALVGGGIIAALLLGATQVTKQFSDSNRDTKTDQFLTFWTERVKITLRNKSACENTLVTPGAIIGGTISEIRDSSNNVILSSLPAAQQGYFGTRLRLSSIGVDNFNLERKEAKVFLNFDRVKAGATATTRFVRSFTVKVETLAAAITSCWDQSKHFEDALETLICRDVHDGGGGINDAGGEIIFGRYCSQGFSRALSRIRTKLCMDTFGVSSTVNCINMYAEKSCPSGQIVAGWAPEAANPVKGNFICVPTQ